MKGSERRIGEHAIENQPISGAATSSCRIVADNSKIIFGYVGELRAAGAFTKRPYVRRSCLQSAIDANVAAPVEFDASLLQSDTGGVRNAPSCDAPLDAVTRGTDNEPAPVTCSTSHGRAIAYLDPHQQGHGALDWLETRRPDMIRKATLVLIAVAGIASPALAQSWDPDNGTGNIVTVFNGAAAEHQQAAGHRSGRNSFALVPREDATPMIGGAYSSGYEELLKTH